MCSVRHSGPECALKSYSLSIQVSITLLCYFTVNGGMNLLIGRMQRAVQTGSAMGSSVLSFA